MKPDVHYILTSDHMRIRLTPNPDAPPNGGYKSGAVLEWQEVGADTWSGYFFIPHDAIKGLAFSLEAAAKGLGE